MLASSGSIDVTQQSIEAQEGRLPGIAWRQEIAGDGSIPDTVLVSNGRPEALRRLFLRRAPFEGLGLICVQSQDPEPARQPDEKNRLIEALHGSDLVLLMDDGSGCGDSGLADKLERTIQGSGIRVLRVVEAASQGAQDGGPQESSSGGDHLPQRATEAPPPRLQACLLSSAEGPSSALSACGCALNEADAVLTDLQVRDPLATLTPYEVVGTRIRRQIPKEALFINTLDTNDALETPLRIGLLIVPGRGSPHHRQDCSDLHPALNPRPLQPDPSA